MGRIPKEEQETIIQYNAQEDAATLYTLDKALIKKVDGWAKKYPEQVEDVTKYRIVREEDAKWYTIAKSMVKLVPPTR